MKKILSLIIFISLVSYLLAGRCSCPSFHYICCSSNYSDTCKCVRVGVEEECKLRVSCKNASQRPIYTQEGYSSKSTCK